MKINGYCLRKMPKMEERLELSRLMDKDTASPFSDFMYIYIMKCTSQEEQDMIYTGDADLGKTVKMLREMNGMSRAKLSEMVNISESHLKKIEAGVRRPGINTYQRILEALGADIIIENQDEKSVKGNCIKKAQTILAECTEKQALYLMKVLECSAQNLQMAGFL